MPSLLQPRIDAFRFKFPDTFFPENIKEKYSELFVSEHGIFKNPVEFLNQSIVGIEFLGMGNGIITQEQVGFGQDGTATGSRNKFGQQLTIDTNRFRHAGAEQYYRSAKNPLAMVDKSFSITFNHTLGFWNYFFMFETFFYQIMRDTPSDDDVLTSTFNVHIINPSTGSELSKILLMEPIIEKIDSLELSYKDAKPVSKTFKVDFKFNNIDYQFSNNYDITQLSGN